MLSTLRNKVVSCSYSLLGLLVVSSTSLALATEQSAFSQNNLQIHGFLSQGIAKSIGSDFVNDDQDASLELTEVGINASYKISPTLRAAGQLVYIDGGNRYADGARLDYLLLDWSAYQSHDWQMNVYLGRFKNYNWLYSSTRDVPHTRPSIVLPQAMYFDGFRDIAVGGDGIATSIKHGNEQLGDFEFNLSFGTSEISDKQRAIILSEFATGDMEHDYDAQMSIFWQPIDSQWRFGWSVLDSDFSYTAGSADIFVDTDIILQRFILNALYEAENWEFSSEVFQERFKLTGFYSPYFQRDTKGQGFYFQTRYQLTQDLKLLARFERFFANKDDKSGVVQEQATGGAIPAYFGFQHDKVLGLSYDLADNVRIQFEHHWVEGTARLTPVVLPNANINDEKYWNMWALQLMYWF